MRNFAHLIQVLDGTNSTKLKVDALVHYFGIEKNEVDRLWMVALFTGKRPQRFVSTTLLRIWCAEQSGIPLWLFEDTYHIIGDLAESIALMLPSHDRTSDVGISDLILQMQSLKNKEEDQKKQFVLHHWTSLSQDEIWIFNKLITGGFRIGVSKNLVIQALAISTGLTSSQVAHTLTGNWKPETSNWSDLFDPQKVKADISKPYPFYLSYPIAEENLSDITSADWIAEWKWDGIRCQRIQRSQNVFIWSRGEELINEQFPELLEVSYDIDNFVLDGEILVWSEEKPMGFQDLQKRMGRKNPGKKILNDYPTIFMAYDVLEYDGQDIRSIPFRDRRKLLESIFETKIGNPNIIISESLPFESLYDLENHRQNAAHRNAEGLMLKSKAGIYHSGRKSGEMWKWKKQPFTIDAVMIYAQRGHGRRAGLFSDFTFALWNDKTLVPFAKAYSGLTDVEMNEITAWVRKNTVESFGPVSSVHPELVFELAFEDIMISSRHKSGVAVRFPRIVRWRKDKNANEIDQLESLKSMIASK
jgi:DNA ligase 1